MELTLLSVQLLGTLQLSDVMSGSGQFREKHASKTIFQIVNAPFIEGRGIDTLEA
jgi:hypothetical protein